MNIYNWILKVALSNSYELDGVYRHSAKSLAIADGFFFMYLKGAVIDMSRAIVSRSYKQLYAERNAMRMMIEAKQEEYNRITKAQLDGTDNGYTPTKLASEIESDKALLKEIENDIEIFRERNRM